MFKKKLKPIFLAVFVVFILLIALFVCYFGFGNRGKSEFDRACSISNNNCTVQFVNVGQGDCELILNGGQAVLIDSGEVDKGVLTVKHLKRCGVKKINLLIGTHPHTDHIGGFLEVLENFNVEKILLPQVPQNLVPTNEVYIKILKLIKAKQIPVEKAAPNLKYEIGDGVLNVLGPLRDNYSNLNDCSIGVRFVCGDRSFLMCGDMQKEAERDLLKSGQEIRSDVFKLNHHGSKTSNTMKFLNEVKADYYVAEVGFKSEYGHPHKEVVKRLKDSKFYRTDLNGTIIFETDGKKLNVFAENKEAA